jgi:hypothetical protein
VSQDVEEGGKVLGYARRRLDDIIAMGEEGGWLELLNTRCVCMHTFVCMYACVLRVCVKRGWLELLKTRCVCMHTFMYACICLSVEGGWLELLNTRCVCMHAFMCMYACVYSCVCVYIYIYIYTFDKIIVIAERAG